MLEKELRLILWIHVAARSTRSDEAASQLALGVSRKPLGVLLRELRNAGVLTDALLADIQPLVKRRNVLVHHFMEQWMGRMGDPRIWSSLVEQCSKLARDVHEVSRQLDSMLAVSLAKLEFSETAIQEAIAQLMSGAAEDWDARSMDVGE